RHNVGFAGGFAAGLQRVHLRSRAAENQPNVVGQILLGKLGAECVDDPSEFIDCAIAHFGTEDSRRVSGLAAGLDLPGHTAAAAGSAIVHAVKAGGRLEFESDIAVLGGGDHVSPRDLERVSCGLFVTAEYDLDV